MSPEVFSVLVVDDEPGIRAAVARVLTAFSFRLAEEDAEVRFEVEVAASGEEAQEMAAARAPDICLLDHKLPGIQGLEVLDRLAVEFPDTLVIMITAYATIETAVSATKRGAYDFLAKPFTPDELKSTLRKAARHLLLQRQARRLAQEKRQVRFQFISILGHELKAPLASVEGYLQILKDHIVEPGSPKYDEVMERSLLRVAAMRKIIADLLDLTRIESGQKKRDLQRVDLTAAAERAMEMASEAARARGIAVELRADSHLFMEADPGEVEMIMNNLVSNAVKYNRENGRVEVDLANRGGVITISVTDTGIGLSAEEQALLFKEFSRVKSPKTRDIPGSGLGLSIVRKVALLYGGDATVQSTPGEGSTFTVTLKSAG
jgi:signal transduction histidine kinase